MRTPTLRLIAATLGLLLAGTPSLATAQLAKAGDTVTLTTSHGLHIGNDVAYDPVNDVYLVVTGNGAVNGAFVSGSGAPIGGVFAIKPGTSPYAHWPRVVYSPHLTNGSTGSGGFLVTWHMDSLAPGVNAVHARAVAYGVGPTGPELVLSSSATNWNIAAAIAYSETSRRFLVAWTNLAWDIEGRFIDVDGSGLLSASGGVIPIAPAGGGGMRNPGVAWDSANNQFGVSYAGWGGGAAFAGFVRVRASDAGLEGRATFGHAAGTYLTDIVFNPATGNFVVAWSNAGGSNRAEFSPASALLGAGLLSSTLGGSTSLGVAFNPVSGTVLATGQNMLWCDIVVAELDSDGVPLSSAAGINACGETDGSYFPRAVGRNNARQFSLSFSFNFTNLSFQRIATSSTGTGGGGGGEPHPPPPPPPCTPTVAPLSGGFAGAGGQMTISVGGTCTWSASASASWIAITSGGSGSGEGTVHLSIAPNATGGGRSGTVTISGQTVSIVQHPMRAAVHDLSGDGRSDIMWHNPTTGQIAAWNLNGHIVTAAYYLNGALPIDVNWKVVGTGDLDGDGYADIVWRHSSGLLGAWLMGANTQVLATLTLRINGNDALQSDPDWRIRGIGDLDGDGKADLIWQHEITGHLAVWFMNGRDFIRAEALSVSHMTDPAWKIVGVGDINRDGRADIVWQNESTGHLAAWLMNGSQAGAQQMLSAFVPDMNWRVRGVGDTNGDGIADLIWQNIANGRLGVWYLNGFNVLAMYSLSIDSVTDLNWQVVGPS